MSVHKLDKQPSKIEHLTNASELRKVVMIFLRKFPKGYERVAVNGISELVIDIHRKCFCGDSLHITVNSPKSDFKERRNYFRTAYVESRMLIADLKYLFDRMLEGQNFYKTAAVYNNFETIVKLLIALAESLKKVMQNDLTIQKLARKKRQMNKNKDLDLKV